MDENVYDEFVRTIVATVREFYGDDPKTCRHYGRIISSRHLKRIADMLARSKGRVLIGGEHDDSAQHYFAPTIVEVSSGEDALMKDEIFGPILPILKVKNTGEAISFVNERAKPLAMYLFCHDYEITKHVLSSTTSGSVGVNETIVQVAGGESFLGGVGESGMGRYGGKEGFETFSHKRPVMYASRTLGSLLQFMHPIYFSTEDGDDPEGMAGLMRCIGKVPHPGSGRVRLSERICNAFGIISTVATVIGAAIRGRRIVHKDQ